MRTFDISATAQRLRDAGIPDILNRWLTMTPEEAASIESRRQSMAKIGPKEQRAREMRSTSEKQLTSHEPARSHTQHESSTGSAEMAKKPHPADIATAQAVAEAERYEVSLLVNREHIVHPLKTMADAIKAGALMEETHANGKLSIIYAVSSEGRSTMVPRSLYPNPTKETVVATKPAKTTKAKKPPEAKPAPAGARARFDWNAAQEAAAKGSVPAPPDFSADTHAPYRKVLGEVHAAAKAGDLAALRKIKVNPTSSSPKAVERYRLICLDALKAKKAA